MIHLPDDTVATAIDACSKPCLLQKLNGNLVSVYSNSSATASTMGVYVTEKQTDGSWTATLADTCNNINMVWAEMGTDDNPRIIYYNNASKKLIYLTPTTTGYWTRTLLVQNLNLQSTHEFKIASDGEVFVVFAEKDLKEIRLIRFIENCLPGQPGAISGPGAGCQGEVGLTYSIPSIPNAVSYQWSVTGGSGVSGTSTTNTITLSLSSITSSFTLKVKGLNNCGEGPETTKFVTVNNLPPQSTAIAGPMQVCEGIMNEFSVAPQAGSELIWSFPEGWTGYNYSSSVALVAGNSSGNIEVTPFNDCGFGPSSMLYVNTTPNDWLVQNNGFTNSDYIIYHLSIIDSNTVWAATMDNIEPDLSILLPSLLRTTDGGVSWIPVTAPYPGCWNEMVFGLDANTAWMPLSDGINGGGKILKTNNGGLTWTHQSTAQFSAPYGWPHIVHFWNASDGVCIGDPNGGYHEIYTTNNGGSTWTRVPSSQIPFPLPNDGVTSNYSVSGNTIWFSTYSGRLFKSVNKGVSWTVYNTPSSNNFQVHFRDTNNGIISCVDYNSPTGARLYETINGGSTWNEVITTGDFYPYFFSWIPGTVNTCVSAGNPFNDSTGMSFSLDGGHTWEKWDCMDGFLYISVRFLNNHTGWIGSLSSASIPQATGGIYKFHGLLGNNVPPPLIVNQPQTVTQCEGGNVSFTVDVSGPGPFTYQWKKNGMNVTNGVGANTSTLTLNNIDWTFECFSPGYTCVISNAGGTVTSNPAHLFVAETPWCFMIGPQTVTGGQTHVGYGNMANMGQPDIWTYTGQNVVISPRTTPPLGVYLDFAGNATSGNLICTPLGICGQGASFAYPITVIRPSYEISIVASPEAGGTTCGSGTFPLDSLIAITATPSTDYIFEGWTEGGVTISAANPFIFNVQGNRNFVAVFTAKELDCSAPIALQNHVTYTGNRNNGLNNGIIEKYCYNNDPANCDIYGGLYQWDEMMQYSTEAGAQGICPEGWHIPTKDEWLSLINGLGGSAAGAGGKLKETGLIFWRSPNSGATNESGFSALGSGYRDCASEAFSMFTERAQFWSSTQKNNTQKHCMELNYYDSGAFASFSIFDNYAQSVRCLKNICIQDPTQSNAGPDQTIEGVTTNLAANISESGNGSWSIISGTGGIIPEPDNPTSVFTGITGNTYALTWTISTNCASSIDLVNIAFNSTGQGIACPGLPSLNYGGQTYNTVQIGSHCWMKENLNIGTMVNSVNSGVYHSDCSNNGIIEKYCFIDDPAYCAIYGGLYDWNEMMQYTSNQGAQGICPAGWHIPISSEYVELQNFLGGSSVAGGKMKEPGNLHWAEPNIGATNESGFTGLGTGRRFGSGFFTDLAVREMFWNSEEYDSNSAMSAFLYFELASLSFSPFDKTTGLSVRCVKNTCDQIPTQSDAGPDQTITGNSTILAANIPESGNGIWNIISGTGGTITEPDNPTSTFTGIMGTTYLLTWTISTPCSNSSDIVTITFNYSGPGAPCPGNPSFTYGGQTYNTVQIGDQCWMKENLNIGTMITNTTDPGNNATLYSCSSLWHTTSGREAIHQYTSVSYNPIQVIVTNAPLLNCDFFILDSCDKNTCLAWGDKQGTLNAPDSGKTYLIVVDGAGMDCSGYYQITVDQTEPQYMIATSALPEAGGVISGGGIYSQNQIATLEAIPNTGYAFTYWQEGSEIVSDSAVYSFTVTSARTLTAVFCALLPPPEAISGPGALCKGTQGITYSITPVPEAVSYEWILPEGFTGNSTSPSITIDVSLIAESGQVIVRGIDACGPGQHQFINVIVSAPPLVTYTPSGQSAICVSTTNYTLSGGLPPGGTYSGPGVSGNYFNAGLTGPGTFPITYTYGNGACTSSATNTITVYSSPEVTLHVQPAVFCINSPAIALGGGLPAGGNYSGTGVAGNLFSAQVAGEGSHIISYTYTDTHGCINTSSDNLTVNPKPWIDLYAFSPVCEGEELWIGSSGGSSLTWTGPDNFMQVSFEPDLTIPNVTLAAGGTYHVTVMNEYDCSDTSSIAIEVEPYGYPDGNTIDGPDQVIPGQGDVTYTLVTNGQPAYIWDYYYSGTGVGITYIDEVTLQLNFSDTATSGNLEMIGPIGNCLSGYYGLLSDPYPVTVAPPSYEINADAIPEYGGTITGTGTFIQYSSITLTAVAQEGWIFRGWFESDTLVTPAPYLEFLAVSDRELTARFTLVYGFDCQQVIPVTENVPYFGNTSTADTTVKYYPCSEWDETGPERIHRFIASGAGLYRAELSNLPYGQDLDLFLLSACHPDSCILFGNNQVEFYCDTAGVKYYLVVDGYFGAYGDYTLTVYRIDTLIGFVSCPVLSPDIIVTGNEIAVTANVKNMGTTGYEGNLTAYIFNMFDYTLADILGSVYVNLDVDESTNINFYKSPSPLAPGDYLMAIYADGYDYVYEGDCHNGFYGYIIFSVYTSSQTYNLTLSANPDDGGSVYGGGDFPEGQYAEYYAVPNEGWTFINWTENGIILSENSWDYLFMDGDHIITANFCEIPGTPGPISGNQLVHRGDVGQPYTITSLPGITDYYWIYSGNGVTFSTVTGHTNLIDFGPYATSGWLYVSAVNNCSMGDFGEPVYIEVDTSVCGPGWPEPGFYDQTMTFILKLYFGQQLSTNPADSLAAFINGECRGKGERDIDNPEIIYLSVGSDNLPDEIVHFKAWNSTTCEESEVWESYPFSDTLIGNPVPISVHTGWNELNIPLSGGWNWISVNVTTGSMDINKVLAKVVADNTSQIKSQTQFAIFNGVKWTGALKTLDPRQMYALKVTSAQNWESAGLPVPITTVPLNLNWTWLGYLPQVTLTTNTALDSLYPAPAANSIIKDQYKFAKYNGIKWTGALTSLSPGKGYKLQLTQASTLLYPSPAKSGSGSSVPYTEPLPSNLPLSWKAVCDKEFNLTLLCKVKLDQESFSNDPDDVIAAFVGNECRGFATPDKENPGIYFLSVNSDVPSMETIRFRYLSAAKSDIAEVHQQLRYENAEDLGTLSDPVILTLASPTAIKENEIVNQPFLGENYPDPFTDVTTIPFGLAERAHVTLKVYDLLGREVMSLVEAEMKPGLHQVKTDKQPLGRGMYYYRIEVVADNERFVGWWWNNYSVDRLTGVPVYRCTSVPMYQYQRNITFKS
ncbi:MAG: immunoglobulin domain-containing protein [Bacteroidetes bacterium]|nr:immunoglobulin domain-containing protein [Bacteroidota bacterium]